MKRAVLLLVVAFVASAGCAQLEDAQHKIDDATREAQEARERYDRVSSATVIREELLRLILVAMSDENESWFEAAAWRGEIALPRENLTTFPPVRVIIGAQSFACDPLTCRFAITGADANVTWADGAPGNMTFVGGRAGCVGEDASSAYCLFPSMERVERVRVTTAIGDVAN